MNKIKYEGFSIANGAKFGYILASIDENGIMLKIKKLIIVDPTGHKVGELPINTITPTEMAKIVFRDGCIDAWGMIDKELANSAAFLTETINSAHKQCQNNSGGWHYIPSTHTLYDAISQHPLYDEIRHTATFYSKRAGDTSESSYRKMFKQVLSEECEIEAKVKAKFPQISK